MAMFNLCDKDIAHDQTVFHYICPVEWCSFQVYSASPLQTEHRINFHSDMFKGGAHMPQPCEYGMEL